jgi:monodictyphenone polyketide synthase
VNVLSNSDAFAGLSHGHFLTKTPNACKTWDAEADGYCRAEGVASIIMKRLEDATADNDNILGVILAAGTNHSAEAVSITHPHAGAQSFLYKKVLDRAGVDPFDVSYIEAHGTGTQAGDVQELTSITDVFAPTEKQRSNTQPLTIGSIKANLGHGEAVAGATALLKVLLMFQKEMIPRHIGIKTCLNPKLSDFFSNQSLCIPIETKPWVRNSGKSRVAMVNSFSAAGGNTCLLLEEAPTIRGTFPDPRPTHVVSTSAKSKESLRGNMKRLLGYLEQNPECSLADLSYTTTARRQHHSHRAVIHASNISEVQQQLRDRLKDNQPFRSVFSNILPSVAFTFTGQGSANKSSNLELFKLSPVFRTHIMALDHIAQRLGFPSFIQSIDGSCNKDYDQGPVVTQVSLVCVEIGLARYWASLGVKPDVVIGHSIGEYAALCVAGVISASDAIHLVGRRAKLLEEKCHAGTHAMLAVRASLATIKTHVKGLRYEVACINSAEAIVLSGTAPNMDAVSEVLRAQGCSTTLLDVSFAFHSSQTDAILDDFEYLAKSISYSSPKIPIISPLLARLVCDSKTVDGAYFRRATRETCDFYGGVSKALSMKIITNDTVWVEIGPHPVTIAFVKAIVGSPCIAVPSIRRLENNWTTVAQSLSILHSAGFDVSWSEFHRPFETNLRLLDLPTYSWNNKNYWIQYNGDWALTKGNTFYSDKNQSQATKSSVSSLKTSLVHTVVKETFSGTCGTVTIQSDLMSADFLAAARGHSINGCSVVTSASISNFPDSRV